MARGRGKKHAIHAHDGHDTAAAAASTAVPADVDIVIDGSEGEGGGQILRTSLALAIITGKSLRIHSIRAKRPRPGLARQHLVAVSAAADIGGGELSGASIGSTTLVYRPPPALLALKDSYEYDIGSAGSASLVLQTVLPVLLNSSRTRGSDVTVTIRGGTHNPMSPPHDFLEACFLPAVAAMGWSVRVELLRHGFYPGGGGCLRATVRSPGALLPYSALHRGSMLRRVGVVLSAGYTEAEASAWELELKRALDWHPRDMETRAVDAAGSAIVLYARVSSEGGSEVVTEFPDRPSDVRASARAAAAAVSTYMNSGAPVGEHLADQLLLPMVLAAGGSFVCSCISEHFRTQVSVMHRFLGVRVAVHEHAHTDAAAASVAVTDAPESKVEATGAAWLVAVTPVTVPRG